VPELPEVETIRRGLEKTIIGKKIVDVEVRLPKIISIGPAVVSNIRKNSAVTAKKFRTLAVGHKIIGVSRRAKMLMIDLSGLPAGRQGPLTILVHLKMTGQMIFAKKGEKKAVKIFNALNSRRETLPHQYTHVIFKFSDGSHLYYNDIRQFGYLRLVRDQDLEHVRELAEYGPEPDDKKFTVQYFMDKAMTRPKLSIKQFLMDPKIVAGIGNIYSDEILYWAKIRPARVLRSLDLADFSAIYRAVPKVLKGALKAGGSSVGDFFRVDGSEGHYGRVHMVYGRYGENCRVCGEEIMRVKLGGRTGSYCPHCQK